MLLPDFVDRFPHLTPPPGRPPLVLCGFIKSTPLEGQTAPSPWRWCLLLFVLLWMDLWRHDTIVCKKWYKNNPKEGLCGVTFLPTLACTTPTRACKNWICIRLLCPFQPINLFLAMSGCLDISGVLDVIRSQNLYQWMENYSAAILHSTSICYFKDITQLFTWHFSPSINIIDKMFNIISYCWCILLLIIW